MGHWSLTTAVWIQLACKFIVHLYLIKLQNPNQPFCEVMYEIILDDKHQLYYSQSFHNNGSNRNFHQRMRLSVPTRTNGGCKNEMLN